MNYLDVIIIIPLIWGIYKGYKKGFIIEISSFIALGLGIYGGIRFSSLAAAYLSELLEVSDKIMPLISFSITFILIVIIVLSLAKMVEKLIKVIALGLVNRIAGAIFGLLKFSLIMSVVLHIINIVNSKITFIDPEVESSSILYQPVSKAASIIIPELENLNLNHLVEKASNSLSVR